VTSASLWRAARSGGWEIALRADPADDREPRRAAPGRRRRRADRAVSDVVGTTLLLGITVTIASAAALHAGAFSQEKPLPMQLSILPLAQAGQRGVQVLHGGGSALDAGELRAQVAVNGTVWFDGDASPAARDWRIGESIDVGPLPQALPPNARVEVSLAHRAGGQLLATAQTLAASPQATRAGSPGFSVDLTLAGGAGETTLEPPAGLLVEAAISHPEGRKVVRFVFADVQGLDGIDWQELRDDGSNGDRVSGDMVYSAVALVPINATSGTANVTATAVDFNGTRVSDAAAVRILVRDETTELSLNPTGSPAPGASTCPAGNAAISSILYQVNGRVLVPRLAGSLHQGDTVKVSITPAAPCAGLVVTLASYAAMGPSFTWDGAANMTLHDVATLTLGASPVLLEVDVPNCYFSVALARGAPLASFGPASSNNYYSRQARLLDADNGGTTPCA
jgi:FlaG/FlaF family flagellin (archaellin)